MLNIALFLSYVHHVIGVKKLVGVSCLYEEFGSKMQFRVFGSRKKMKDHLYMIILAVLLFKRGKFDPKSNLQIGIDKIVQREKNIIVLFVDVRI